MANLYDLGVAGWQHSFVVGGTDESYDMLTGRIAWELVAARSTADGRFRHGPNRSIFWTNIPEAEYSHNCG